MQLGAVSVCSLSFLVDFFSEAYVAGSWDCALNKILWSAVKSCIHHRVFLVDFVLYVWVLFFSLSSGSLKCMVSSRGKYLPYIWCTSLLLGKNIFMCPYNFGVWQSISSLVIIKVAYGIFQAILGVIGSPYRLTPVSVSVTFLLKRLSEINCQESWGRREIKKFNKKC